jgi:ABC-type amino acid transport substrate-binding protein
MENRFPVAVMAVCGLVLFSHPVPGADESGRGVNSPAAVEPVVVKVGGYVFPPYVEEEKGVFQGLTLDLIELLNSFQSGRRFEFVPTSPFRRYKDFKTGAFDMIPFENIEWGWEGLDVIPTRTLGSDCEVYVAKAEPGRGQSYFDNFANLSKLVFLGYHYPFADYTSDPEVLMRKYNARATASHEGAIKAVAENRADVAVVTLSYLTRYLRDRPALIPKFLISDKIEQRYRHSILVRKSGPVRVEELNSWISKMERMGYLDMLWSKYALNRPECRMGARRDRTREASAATTSAPRVKTVRVGGYPFPPYVEDEGGTYTGAVIDLIELLNSFQTELRFEFVPTSAARRFKDLIEGAYDVLFFQPKEWGPVETPLTASRPYAKDREVCVTRTEDGGRFTCYAWSGEKRPLRAPRPQESDSLGEDPERPQTDHAERGQGENIAAVLDKRVDAAMVTKSFLQRYLQLFPSIIPLLHVSDKPLQPLTHRFVIRADYKQTAEEIGGLIAALEKAGYLAILYDKYELETISGRP